MASVPYPFLTLMGYIYSRKFLRYFHKLGRTRYWGFLIQYDLSIPTFGENWENNKRAADLSMVNNYWGFVRIDCQFVAFGATENAFMSIHSLRNAKADGEIDDDTTGPCSADFRELLQGDFCGQAEPNHIASAGDIHCDFHSLPSFLPHTLRGLLC